MTFRRRLLVATVTLGGGICCFQPIMQARMESRFSEISGARVDIGSSKISLVDGTIAFRDIVIHHSSSPRKNRIEDSPRLTKIEHAALQFDWNSLLYRNLKVDGLVASDVLWQLANPSRELIPTAVESSDESSEPSLFDQADRGAATDVNIEPIIQPIHLRIVEEAARQSRVHLDVSSRLESVSEQIAEAIPPDGSLNVLRQRFVLDDAKKELATIQQSIAEDRLARKDSDKRVSSLTQSAQKSFIASLAGFSELESAKINQAALNLAKFAIAKEWNRNRSVVHAAIASLSALRPQDSKDSRDSDWRQSQTRASDSEFLAQFPVGFTRFVSGKVQGIVQFPSVAIDLPESTSGFELQFRNFSSRDFLEREKPAISLRMNRKTPQNESPWLICTAQQVDLPQSDATQVQVVLEKNQPGQSKCTTTIQHANQGWAASISLPIQNCFDLPTSEPVSNANSLLNEKTNIVGRLIGATSSQHNEQNELLIAIDNSSVIAVEAILSPRICADVERKRSQASIRGTELLNSELQKMGLRWDQLGDEHTRSHQNWETSLTELKDQLQRLEAALKRTSRASKDRETRNKGVRSHFFKKRVVMRCLYA